MKTSKCKKITTIRVMWPNQKVKILCKEHAYEQLKLAECANLSCSLESGHLESPCQGRTNCCDSGDKAHLIWANVFAWVVEWCEYDMWDRSKQFKSEKEAELCIEGLCKYGIRYRKYTLYVDYMEEN